MLLLLLLPPPPPPHAFNNKGKDKIAKILERLFIIMSLFHKISGNISANTACKI